MYSADERRRHARSTYLVNTEYVLDPPTSDERFKGAVVNVSDCGMSLFVIKPLDIGQHITLACDAPDLPKTAVVRWIKQVGGFYKIGVECRNITSEL
jgi:hypothetical protein